MALISILLLITVETAIRRKAPKSKPKSKPMNKGGGGEERGVNKQTEVKTFLGVTKIVD